MRVRVTARVLYGRSGGRRIRYVRGDELTCSASFHRRHADALRVLATDSVSREAASESDPDKGAAGSDVTRVDDLEALRAEAESLGIDVSKRWREGRLTEEIAKAKAASESGEQEP